MKRRLLRQEKHRCYIIDEILLKAIPAPREELSAYAPKAETMKIDVDKIREVIGQGGKVIQRLLPETGAKIDIEEDGTNPYLRSLTKKAVRLQKTLLKLLLKNLK